MPVILRTSKELPSPSAYDAWFVLTEARGRGEPETKIANLANRLEAAFDDICPEWLTVAAALSDTPGAELAYAPTAAAFGSDFGLMMACGRLVGDVAEETQTYLVVCDDPWLFRHLAELPGVVSGTAPALWWTTLKFRLRGLIGRLRLMARLSWATLATQRYRGAAAPGAPAILVYGHPGSTADGYDTYFGPMLREVSALGRVLHTDCRPRRVAELAADGRTVSLHAWGRAWLTPGLLFQYWRPGPGHLRGSYGWLVRRAAEIEASGAAHAMNAWQHQCQAAWLNRVRPSVVVWPWENHGWERVFCRAARRFGVTTVGYQHTVIGRHQLNYSPASNRDGATSLPDLILCNGPAYRDQLLDWGVPPDRLSIGGSLRIQQLQGLPYDPDGPVFVALSAKRNIARVQIEALQSAAEKGFYFLVKEHPMYPVNFQETDRICRTRDPLDVQPPLSAVFFATGTVGLEALLAGFPTFRLLPETDIGIDIMPAIASAIDVTANGLAKALSGISKPPALIWEDVLSPVDWPLWKRLLSTGSIATAADETATDAARQSNERTA